MFKSKKSRESSAEPKAESKAESKESSAAPSIPDTTQIPDSPEPADPELQEDQKKTSGMFKILAKLIGVKDLINLRLSLPTQYLDPVSNLEYWGYMEHPDYFIRIPDNDDPVERIINTARWWIVKDSKFLNKKLSKPFNSVLGEQFFCKWLVEKKISTSPSESREVSPASDNSSYRSVSQTSTGATPDSYQVEYITEQVSHHPPVSAYSYRCEEKKIEAVGLDHISARFASLSVIISPGSWNKGIFLTLGTRDNETYNCTHSNGQVVGWLTNKLKAISIGTIRITCPKTKLACILDFAEKNWYGKIKDIVEGVVFTYDPENSDIQDWTSKTIPSNITPIAKIKGQWDGKTFVEYTSKPESEPILLVDMHTAKPGKKIVKPIEEQGENESRKVWGKVMEKMVQRDYTNATKLKIELEEYQRTLATERVNSAQEFIPALFVKDFDDGKPKLLDDAKINI
ncbi:hypothetical protein BB561_002628 [Smittium simulii]|uniref:Oxysterol-binding protein n=1 Tax=Smittium simulii TaxID=133385 RepID=A0A2T9YPS3_9FUNG|nr:hypothetical protein BB561_002628 [Smittium simulii]